MSIKKTNKMTLGFCPMCMQNVEHTRTFSSPFYNLLDLLILRVTKFFRVGPWYCYQCEGKSLYLRAPRRSAPTFDSEKLSSRFAEDIVRANNQNQPAVADSVGNYLKTDRSLVMRDKRTRQYSQKFRDGAVMRILEGHSALNQVRNELHVKESDLINWIASLMKRKQERIDELVLALEAVKANLPHHLQIEMEQIEMEQSETETQNLEGTVVEGRVSPR